MKKCMHILAITLFAFLIFANCKRRAASTGKAASSDDAAYTSRCGDQSPLKAAAAVSGAGKDLGAEVVAILSKPRAQKSGTNKSCESCHSADPSKDVAGFGNILELENLQSFVDRADPKGSQLYKAVSTQSGKTPRMPQGGKEMLSQIELDTLAEWMAAGSPRPNENQTGNRSDVPPFISDTTLTNCMLTDIKKLPVQSQAQTRYFTLTHFHNAQMQKQLQQGRVGISKLVNSLSMNPKITKPVPVDPGQTIYRINLQNYGWSADLWQEIQDTNPYRFQTNTAEAAELLKLSGNQIPNMRGDWFTFKVFEFSSNQTEPSLYYRILNLPSTEVALEQLLLPSGVTVQDNIRAGRSMRAGFHSQPGVSPSLNNRIIERHPSRAGYYWLSYDFEKSEGDQNIFDKPLGPGTDSFDFVHNGGEMVFSLPNHLQAYYIAKADGERLSGAPVNIVQDPSNRRHGSQVINGYSCMGCHYEGVKTRQDQIRGFVATETNFPDSVRQRVFQLYRGKNEMDAQILRDQEQFRKAVEQTGGSTSDADEPIRAMVYDFESDVTIARAAAETGLTVSDFQARLANAPELRRRLTFGGTSSVIPRKAFNSAFPKIVTDLHIGSLASEAVTDDTSSETCSVGGVRVEKGCWYLGNLQESCETVCTTRRLEVDDLTITFAGSGGTDINCQKIDQAIHSNNSTRFVPGMDCSNLGLGCALCGSSCGNKFKNALVRCTNPTNQTDNLVSMQRYCSCKSP